MARRMHCIGIEVHNMTYPAWILIHALEYLHEQDDATVDAADCIIRALESVLSERGL